MGNNLAAEDLIMAREKYAAIDARNHHQIPTPSGKLWEAIQKHYDLPEPETVDSVLSKIKLPDGWKMSADPEDVYNRYSIITDHEGRKVGMTFLKNTGYDYNGYTLFYVQRLQELGINGTL